MQDRLFTMKTAVLLIALVGAANGLKVLQKDNNEMVGQLKKILEPKLEATKASIGALETKLRTCVAKCNKNLPHIENMMAEDDKDIEEFDARANEGDARAKAARNDIAELEAVSKSAEAKISTDTQSADKIKEKTKAKKAELNDTMMALTGAIAKLESTASFIQLPEDVQKTVAAFVQGGDLDSSTGDLINTLKEARDDFRNELQELSLSSANEINSLRMAIAANQNEVENNKNHMSDLEEEANAADGDANKARKNKVASEASKADYKALKASTSQWCSDTQKEVKGLLRLEAQNLDGINNSMRILDSGAFIQKSVAAMSGSSFIQTQSSDPRTKVLAFLAGQAKDQKSHALAQLVSRAETAGGFDKVLKMIRDMIKKKQGEGNEEEKHFRVCQNMKADNKSANDRADNAVDGSNSARDEAAGAMQDATDNLQKKNQELTDNEEDWQTTKSESTAAVRQMEDDNSGDQHFKTVMDKALKALQVMASPPTALVAIIKKEAENTDARMSDRNGAIAQQNDDLDKSEQEYKLTKARVEPEIADFKEQVSDAVSDKTNAESLLEDAQVKKDAATKTAAEISNQCDAKPESHEAKVQRYNAEIQSLKDALEMISA